MKLIINTTTLVGSGVTQVAVSFLYECLQLEDRNEYHIFLGKKVNDAINRKFFDSRFHFYEFFVKPLDVFSGGVNNITAMKKLEIIISPDAVFTLFGPSWWTPKSPHLQGFANPYYIFKEGPFYKNCDFKTKFKLILFEKIHSIFLRRNGRYFVTETEFVSDRLSQLLKVDSSNVFTVTNTCNSFFRNFKDDNRIVYLEHTEDEFRFISLCTMQTHKNLTILNKVIPILKEKGYNNIKFVLTVDENSYHTSFTEEVKSQIINIGRIPPENCPYLFNECDALFLPTLAECFTANYPEAMYLHKAIVTSDLPFAKDICGDSALYFDPLNEQDIADKIIYLYNNKDVRLVLEKKGNNRLQIFLTPKERCIKYLEILKNLK